MLEITFADGDLFQIDLNNVFSHVTDFAKTKISLVNTVKELGWKGCPEALYFSSHGIGWYHFLDELLIRRWINPEFNEYVNLQDISMRKKRGELIARLRKERGISQEQMAENCATFTLNQIITFEEGELGVRRNDLAEIGNSIGIPYLKFKPLFDAVSSSPFDSDGSQAQESWQNHSTSTRGLWEGI
jgi:transcriptional regulator with XRE-family HTH domain